MFIKGNTLSNIKVKTLIVENEKFEIYKTVRNDTVLIVKNSLYERWVNDKMFFNVNPFKKTTIDDEIYFYLKSKKEYLLNTIDNDGVLFNRHQALNFVFTLQQMRKITDVSMFDALYIEEFGYILPTYTNKNLSDDALLGCFFSGNSSKHFSDGNIKSLFLTNEDFAEISKISGIEIKDTPQEIKENIVYTESFKLVGRPELEKFFNEHIVNILKEPERYKKLGIDFPSSIILYGPPGCGKTYAVDRLVEFLKLPKYEINSSSIASPYIHDTSRKISGIFETAIQNAPSVVVIDEMESYLSDRSGAGDSTHKLEEVAEFLRQIQEANKNRVLVIAMTNMLEKIDPAILRKGRFDHHIEVGLPSIEEIENLLNFLIKDISIEKGINTSELSKKLEGKTLADVNFVIKEAALISGKNGLDEVSLQSIDDAINSLPKKQERRRIGFGD
ncbi:ATP-binding protein [bacterium]|nr:ATP-binding protein [bacterium]